MFCLVEEVAVTAQGDVGAAVTELPRHVHDVHALAAGVAVERRRCQGFTRVWEFRDAGDQVEIDRADDCEFNRVCSSVDVLLAERRRANLEKRRDFASVCGNGAVRHSRGKEPNGFFGDRWKRLPDGGERRVAEFGEADAVEAGHAYVVRDVDTGAVELADDAEGDDVRTADNRVGKFAFSEKRANDIASEFDREGTEARWTRPERGTSAHQQFKRLEAAAPRGARGCVGDEDQTAVALLLEVVEYKCDTDRVVDTDVVA